MESSEEKDLGAGKNLGGDLHGNEKSEKKIKLHASRQLAKTLLSLRRNQL